MCTLRSNQRLGERELRCLVFRGSAVMMLHEEVKLREEKQVLSFSMGLNRGQDQGGAQRGLGCPKQHGSPVPLVGN